MCSSQTGAGKEHYVPICPRLGVCGETGLGLASCRTWLCCAGHLALWRSLLQARGKLSASCSAFKRHKHKGSRTGCGTPATICRGIFTRPSWLPSVHGREKVHSTSLLHFHPHPCRPVRWYFSFGGDGGQAPQQGRHCSDRRLWWLPRRCGGITDLSQKGQCTALTAPHPHLRCANPPQLQTP